ncbi:phosphatase PAP2 family protein [candidate division GN15 bacterium]|uniref:Phosphatase PAP2 family protein n=1 Tax=candidate division GN15 bacterium TaxID=2072418 RepID=A0A855X8Q2_9BACT|nr:MAG: phosphatase PAP2 family protein [candidate division GN15 bacterium]
MLEYLAGLDRTIFLFINVHLANPVTDLFMPLVTSDDLLRIAYAAAALLLLWKGDRRTRWLVLFSALTLAVTDQLSAAWLKPFFARPRPCHIIPIDTMRLLVNCGSGYSMPSSHAANAFGQAILFGLAFPRTRWWLAGIAAIIALSRIFVGVHYPGDILVGTAIGILAGVAVMFAYRRSMLLVEKKYPPTGAEGHKQL